MSTYATLVARGCLCGTDDLVSCPLHGPDDNRGLAAFFRAGMPKAFPTVADCAICGAEGLLYPDVELDDPSGSADGPTEHRPTLVCPRCSTPAAESSLRREVEEAGRHELNSTSVFGTGGDGKQASHRPAKAASGSGRSAGSSPAPSVAKVAA